jgi:ribosomal protein L14
MEASVRRKNVNRHVTFDRFLYAVMEAEANKLGIKITSVINQELSKRFQEKVELLKLQEKMKYS